MESNKPYVRTNRFVEISKQEFEAIPCNTWRSCVLLFLKKFGIDFSDPRYSFEFTNPNPLHPSFLKIYLVHEDPKLRVLSGESAS